MPMKKTNVVAPISPPPIQKIQICGESEAGSQTSISHNSIRAIKKIMVEDRETGVSAKTTLINFFKGMIGPGCLSLPLAFKQAGLWTAFILVFFFGLLNNYCMLQLVHCSQNLSKRKGNENLNYGGVAYEACANSFQAIRKYKNQARLIINTFVISLQMGICSVFYVFIAVHMKEIFDEQTNLNYSETVWMFLILVPIIALNFIRTLRVIAIFSMIGNVLMILAFLFIFQHLIRIINFKNKNLPWITNFDGIMSACGSILYSFEGQAIVLPLENKLKRPQQMVGKFGILSVGMTMVSIIYALSGFFGYATYGNEVKGSITLNLPQEPIFTIVKLMLVLVVYFGFVIQLYVIIEMLWPKLKKMLFDIRTAKISEKTGEKNFSTTTTKISTNMILLYEYLFRAILVILAMIMALAVPNLEQIIPLVGVTVGMMLAFVFPACMDLITFLPLYFEEAKITGSYAKIYRRIIINAFLIAIGCFGLIAGLQSNIKSIIETPNKILKKNPTTTTNSSINI